MAPQLKRSQPRTYATAIAKNATVAATKMKSNMVRPAFHR
jgi:hypothetical protein